MADVSIDIEFEFSTDEHVQASDAVVSQTWVRWVSPIAGAFLLVMLVLSGLIVLGSDRPGTALLSLAPWLLLLAIWTGLFRLMNRMGARRVARSDPSVKGIQQRRVDANGFHSSGNGVTVDVPWHAMDRGTETGSFFLFFYNKRCAYYIGKARLSDEQCRAIRALMREHLGERMLEIGARAA